MRLQAIVRGRAVRRQAVTTLKCLQSIVNIQSQVCARRFQKAEECLNCDESKQHQDLKDKVIKVGMKDNQSLVMKLKTIN